MSDKRISVKRYATGKFWMHVRSGTEHDDKIESALVRSGLVTAVVDEDRLRKFLTDAGVPQSVIDATVLSIEVSDDTYDVDEAPRY